MKHYAEISRFFIEKQATHLPYLGARLQPIQAKTGKANVAIDRPGQVLDAVSTITEMIAIRSPEHWQETVRCLEG